MMLESREGEAAAVPVEPSAPAFKPTDADLQQYYSANRSRYMVPEQRVLRIARIGPEQVAAVTASDQEVAAYYNAHKADYAAKETRNISQAVVQDQATANAIAARAKGGATIAAAAAPAGANAAVTSLKDQSRAGLCLGRRRQGRGGRLRRAFRRSRRPDPDRLRLGGREGRFGQDAGRQVARPGARRNRRQAHRRQAQGRDRGPRRQGPERGRQRQQFHRGGRGRRS